MRRRGDRRWGRTSCSGGRRDVVSSCVRRPARYMSGAVCLSIGVSGGGVVGHDEAATDVPAVGGGEGGRRVVASRRVPHHSRLAAFLLSSALAVVLSTARWRRSTCWWRVAMAVDDLSLFSTAPSSVPPHVCLSSF
eukprot:TRINITY_DN5740_c0_g1_i1.p2 TRINITY_DN5740_c0_g1~~TRINITY_DN5740_c0_g1_i1.p2  ORF type:complete len:151 (+),score=7.30 TRINITY_DN5740_c0_g1_i1:46-453(+)